MSPILRNNFFSKNIFKKILFSICTLLLFLSQAGFAFTGSTLTPETMQIELPPSIWFKAYVNDSSDADLTEFIKKGDDINNWREIVTIVFVSYNNNTVGNSMDKYLASIHNGLKRVCPNMQWKTLEKSANSVTYQWQIQGCGTGIKADQIEITRVFMGSAGFNSIHYAIKTSKITETTTQEMLKLINQARVIQNKK